MGSTGVRTAPLFSVVVPVYQVEDYLPACLDSLAAQTFEDYEVIVVDDCSPDDSGRIIDRYAAHDPRIVPIHLDTGRGIGGARNVGIERARGRYLLFLDADDQFTEHALESMAHHLSVFGESDIVLYDYVMTPPCQITVFSNLRRWIPPEVRSPFRVGEHPHALRVPWAAWNKAYHRELLERFRLRFPGGTFEDAPWACISLVSARSVSVLRTVCLRYRRCRSGSVSRSRDPKHADIFAQFDRIFDFLRDHPSVEFPELRGEVMRRMTLIMQDLGAGGGLIPPHMLASFRHQCEQYFAWRRPGGYDGPDLRWPPTPWDAWADTGDYAPRVWGEEPIMPGGLAASQQRPEQQRTPEVQLGGPPFTR